MKTIEIISKEYKNELGEMVSEAVDSIDREYLIKENQIFCFDSGKYLGNRSNFKILQPYWEIKK